MEAGPTHGRPIMEAMGERTSASTPTMPKVVSRNFLLGDICVIVDDAPPKKSWVMGKVIDYSGRLWIYSTGLHKNQVQ